MLVFCQYVGCSAHETPYDHFSSRKSTMDELESCAANKVWMCLVCGLMYEEAIGWPKDGIAPGTRWKDVPLGWCCPECGARKEDFEMVEI